jgi:hypothetical protein
MSNLLSLMYLIKVHIFLLPLTNLCLYLIDSNMRIILLSYGFKLTIKPTYSFGLFTLDANPT